MSPLESWILSCRQWRVWTHFKQARAIKFQVGEITVRSTGDGRKLEVRFSFFSPLYFLQLEPVEPFRASFRIARGTVIIKGELWWRM